MEHDSPSRDQARRATLEAIRELKAAGVDPVLAQKRDAVERALESEANTNGRAVGKPRQFGAFAGKFKIGPEFFEPLSAEELRIWGED